MAKVHGDGARSIFKIQKWLGINENPDGDTGLLAGEAAVMRNFRITDDGHLKLRPGTKTLLELSDGPVRGLWQGYVMGERRMLAAAGGHIWLLDINSGTKTELGALTDAPAHFFGFSGMVYILNGSEYLCWDGSGTVSEVSGYVPLVAISTPPDGGGTLFEAINKLTGSKRQRFSPDGVKSVFQLAEDGIDEVEWVKLGGVLLSSADFSAEPQSGRVTLVSRPLAGVNTLEIRWSKGAGDRGAVESMRFSETYNGLTDTRIFIYGDGSNRALYSGLNESGLPDASYFPDLNAADIDSANTPVTSMVKHFDKLLAFKTDGLWAIEYGGLTLADGSVAAGFYTVPINREIGNTAPGQVRLVDNWPRTLFGRSLYTWKMTGSTVRDERTAERISRRIEGTLSAMSFPGTVTFDDEYNQEFYIFGAGVAVIYNYGSDVFYIYTGLNISAAAVCDAGIYLGTRDGRLLHLSQKYRNDDGAEIDAYWESGSMSFSREWQRKYTGQVWMTIKPESGARVTVTAQSDGRSEYPEYIVSAALITFVNSSFAHWAFGTNRKPQAERVRLKVRRFAFGKLVFKSRSTSAAATILGAEIEFGYGGRVR